MQRLKQWSWLKSIFSEYTIIPWMMGVAIFPMLLLVFFAYDSARTTLQHTINMVLLTEIKKKVEGIDRYIYERELNLIQFSELPELVDIIEASEQNGQLNPLHPEKIVPFTHYLQYITPKIGVKNIYIISTEGNIVFALHHHQLVGQKLSQDNPAHQALYRAYDGTKVLRIPYLFSSFQKNNQFGAAIYLSNVIRKNGFTKAILLMELDPSAIEKVIKLNFGYAKSEQSSLAMLADHKSSIVISTSKPKNIQKTPLEIQAMNKLITSAIAGGMGHPVDLTEGGQPILAIYSYVPQLHMGMIIQYNKAELYQKVHWLKINILVISSISLLIVIMIVLWIANALQAAQMKSARLLENILPKFVISELKEKKQFLARNVHHVSIIFIDIVSFTEFSASQPPEKIVAILDEFFSIFDKLCEKYQLEKIKTIGDAYMAASGLLTPQKIHASQAVNMGLDAILAINQYNLEHQSTFAIRVGVDSGNITAGIIGKKKFSYDLWGTAVNRASRMESTGVANALQISTSTYSDLPDKENYTFIPREHVLVKGFGDLSTYLVSRKEK
jgi:class 3 adenylate cyclase